MKIHVVSLALLLLFTGLQAQAIEFSGYDWVVRSWDGDPGDNHYSDSEENVRVDKLGRLHLRIREDGGSWFCSEVYSDLATGYGIHRFYTIGWLDRLDINAVFAVFLRKDDNAELDIEFSRWGLEDNSYNVEYVVHPSKEGNYEKFLMALNGDHCTQYIDWQPEAVLFKLIHGHYQEPPNTCFCIPNPFRIFCFPFVGVCGWAYDGPDIPAEEQDLKVHMSLWLVDIDGENAPHGNEPVEVVIEAVDLPIPCENTPTGTNVAVRLPGGVTVVYEQVTSPGTTTCTQQPDGPDAPRGYGLLPPPLRFEIATTALHTGNVEICIEYEDTGFPPQMEDLIELRHFCFGEWEDVTTSRDPHANIACGVDEELSLFALMVPLQSALGYELGVVTNAILSLPDDVFKNNPEQRKNALSNKLNAVEQMVDATDYTGAANKLEHDVLAKMDGCLGGKSNNDWITDCDAQNWVHPMIAQLIGNLRFLIMSEKSQPLLEIFPNPCAGNMTLSYGIPANREDLDGGHSSSLDAPPRGLSGNKVRLVVYDVAGRSVRTLVDGMQDEGFHTVIWDGRDGAGRQVSSGVYLARLTVGSSAVCGKVVFVR